MKEKYLSFYFMKMKIVKNLWINTGKGFIMWEERGEKIEEEKF